jgi:hypothetical protein
VESSGAEGLRGIPAKWKVIPAGTGILISQHQQDAASPVGNKLTAGRISPSRNPPTTAVAGYASATRSALLLSGFGGRSSGGRAVLTVLPLGNAGRFAAPFAQIVELCTANLAAAHDVD